MDTSEGRGVPALKRSSESEDDDDRPARRRRKRSSHHFLHHKQSIPTEAALDYGSVQSFLIRSIHEALKMVGFDGADPTAVESFRAGVEEYLSHLAGSVSRSMLSSRRIQPIPQDFMNAISKESLTLSSLSPYLKIEIPPSIALPPLSSLPPGESSEPPLAPLLGRKLQSASEKEARPFVPAHLPPFPGKHTYKATPEYTERENDPRRIRERATEEGRLGEDALRRIVATGGAGRREVAKGSKKEGRRGKEKDVWQSTMDALINPTREASLPNGTVHQLDFREVKDDGGPGGDLSHHRTLQRAVNSERPYWRKSSLLGKGLMPKQNGRITAKEVASAKGRGSISAQ
ncbi:MAG: hypothetical protein M1837_000060 [Sclerophora amabilis]|nr:MAG: hypothetical protein M1837_000060 [Sclerophora amabilis]